jgi:acetyl-CoA synthetase
VVRHSKHEEPGQRFTTGSTPSTVRNRGTKYHWYEDLLHSVTDACPCAEMDSEDMLFLLYTSGSTGKPKGIVHTTGGYLTYVHATCKLTFNMIPHSGQLFWCTADVGRR